jgi:hypothetical protein
LIFNAEWLWGGLLGIYFGVLVIVVDAIVD